MVVGRGNDAIPTWSGFNYQGKMMLLYVLELINQIAKDKNKDIDAYSVELEKTEDFCIICDSEYKSFHQVKAYLSKDKWNSYSKAMDKLLKHRVESNNPTTFDALLYNSTLTLYVLDASSQSFISFATVR